MASEKEYRCGICELSVCMTYADSLVVNKSDVFGYILKGRDLLCETCLEDGNKVIIAKSNQNNQSKVVLSDEVELIDD